MPRVGLTTDVVVAEAARLADEVGLDNLTLSALASRFGVAVPSLYKHLAGADDLYRRLAVLATQEQGAALSKAAVGRSRGDAVRAIGAAYRDYARNHPGRYAASLRAPDPADSEHAQAATAVLETVTDVLAGYGLRGAALIDASRGVRSALHGFVDLDTNGGFGLPRNVDRSFDWLLQALDDALGAAH